VPSLSLLSSYSAVRLHNLVKVGTYDHSFVLYGQQLNLRVCLFACTRPEIYSDCAAKKYQSRAINPTICLLNVSLYYPGILAGSLRKQL
jgi:hypothetical protein